MSVLLLVSGVYPPMTYITSSVCATAISLRGVGSGAAVDHRPCSAVGEPLPVSPDPPQAANMPRQPETKASVAIDLNLMRLRFILIMPRLNSLETLPLCGYYSAVVSFSVQSV